MSRNPFVGTWTYRSFHNTPGAVDSFDEIRLAQAELKLEEDGSDWLTGRLSFGEAFLVMTGTSSLTERRWRLRMRGVGVDGTPTAGWIYDYIGELAADWPEGDAQRPAMIGTVIRTVFHEPVRLAGQSYSFVAVRRPPETPGAQPLPEAVRAHFADREHRLHHAVWHALRNNWLSLPPGKRSAVVKLGWEPPRPARVLGKQGVKNPIVGNGSGEDFLYFHREMMVVFRRMMAAAGAAAVDWDTIPEPGDPDNPVPPAWAILDDPTLERRVAALKTDEYYWSRMRWWDQCFKDPTYLSTLTLGQLGSFIEFSVHNDMHMRWSAAPHDPQTNALLPKGRPQADTGERWDDPKYDWLGEFYASHVNPFFWRLHGWIDDRINDWFEAHRSEIEFVERKGISWFKPDGRWVQVEKLWIWPDGLAGPDGGHPLHHHGDHGSGDGLREKRIASLEAVLDILFDRRATEPGAFAVAPDMAAAVRDVPVSFIVGR